MPISPCVFYTFNWLTLTSEMYFVRFHPEVTSCLLSRGKTKYATLGMRLWCKYIRNYLLVYQLTSHFLPYLRNYKEFEGEISDLKVGKYGLSFKTKKYTTSGWARGDENVIGIRAFNISECYFGDMLSKGSWESCWRCVAMFPTLMIWGIQQAHEKYVKVVVCARALPKRIHLKKNWGWRPRGVLSTKVYPGTCRWNGSQNQPLGITMTPYSVQKLV